MATRYNSTSITNRNVSGIKNGYDGDKSDITIPSCTVEDIDKALFDLFNKELSINVNTSDGVKKVPIIFASGEKWALLKKGRALRDKNNSLILPLISVMRTGINQSTQDTISRGINQHTGEMFIRRSISVNEDRNYQNIINKYLIQNQDNLAISPEDSESEDAITSDAIKGSLSDDPIIRDGAYLLDNKNNNIIETLVIPTPQFFAVSYEVIIWTQYTEQMNNIVTHLMSSYLPQTLGWKLQSEKGYWWMAFVQGDYKPEHNYDDMSTGERIVKYTFDINVNGYSFASKTPGSPIPIKRYISNPSISFETAVDYGEFVEPEADVIEPFLGADDPTLPLESNMNLRGTRDDLRYTTRDKLDDKNQLMENDPALNSFRRDKQKSKWRKVTTIDKNGNKKYSYVRIISQNKHTGETVISASDFILGGTQIVIE